MRMSDHHGRELPRPTRTFRGWILRLIAAALVVAVVLWLILRTADWESFSARGGRPLVHAPPQVEGAHHVDAGDSAAAMATDPALGDRSALQSIEPCVVRIEVDGAAGLEVIGSGFVVEPSGLVATNLHVAAQMTQGVARFRDGAVYEIAGYAALDRDTDLAILQLRSASELPAARLALDDPKPLSLVFAIGHPRGVEFSPFDGRVSRLVATSQLAAGTQKFVRDLTGSLRDHRWIQHTANLSDGNSGGPLVAANGSVIGINTWVDRQTGFGYALPASEIAALLGNQLPEIESLEMHASSEARLRAQLWQTSAEELKKLHDHARAMRWQPTSRRDYSQLQRLAFGLTLANQPEKLAASQSLGDQFEDLVKAADQIVAALRKEKWNDPGQILLLNEFAATEVNRPMTGLVLIGTIERIVAAQDGKRAAIVVLAGFQQRLLVPLDSGLSVPDAGSQCLIVGVNDRGRTVQYGDNPLDPITAPVIIAPIVIVLGK
jgi:S1-C subfamily serine protease